MIPNQSIKYAAFFLIVVFVFASCKKETNNNRQPVAKGGPDQTITLPNNAVTIDGTGSLDPDGSIVSYSWRQTAGPNQNVINNPNQAFSIINNLIQGNYQFELKVTDNGGLYAKD